MHQFLLLLGDLLLIIGCLAFVFLLEDSKIYIASWSLSKVLLVCISIPLITIMIFYILGLYELSLPKRSEVILLYICLGFSVIAVLYSALAYFVIALRPGKINLLIIILMTGALTFLWHLCFQKVREPNPQRLLFVGGEAIFDEMSDFIDKNFPKFYQVVGQLHGAKNPGGQAFSDFLKKNRVDQIVYSTHSELVREIADDLLTINFHNGNVIDAHNFYQQLTGKCPLYFIDNFWLLVNANKRLFTPVVTDKIKRGMDILVALVLLSLAWPILIIIAIAVRLNSKGPVLFVQERLGQYETPFRVIKFRTMIDNAEKATGPRWSTEDDPRITRVGKILRKLRLDELPQFFNVLKGEMSLVGPRPIRRHFANILAKDIPFYRLRFLAKPGLTGWAQVNHNYAGSNEGQAEKQQFDLFYLIHQSLWLDLLILFKTVKIAIWAKGM